jgi:hypothetical protein
MNKVISIVAALLLCLLAINNDNTVVNAFAPSSISNNKISAAAAAVASTRPGVPQRQQRFDTRQFINLGERERDALTRESEPENFFAT